MNTSVSSLDILLPSGAFELTSDELYMTGGGWWEDVTDWFSGRMEQTADFLGDWMGSVFNTLEATWDWGTNSLSNGWNTVSTITGNFIGSLDSYLAANDYSDHVIMPDANTLAGELFAVIDANPASLSLVEISTLLVEGYIIGVGLNTIEYWGTALGTATAETIYD